MKNARGEAVMVRSPGFRPERVQVPQLGYQNPYLRRAESSKLSRATSYPSRDDFQKKTSRSVFAFLEVDYETCADNNHNRYSVSNQKCLALSALDGLANYDEVVQDSAQKNRCCNYVSSSEGDAGTQKGFAFLIF
jgi:hypothetical protein